MNKFFFYKYSNGLRFLARVDRIIYNNRDQLFGYESTYYNSGRKCFEAKTVMPNETAPFRYSKLTKHEKEMFAKLATPLEIIKFKNNAEV